MKNKYEQVIETVKSSESIALFCHINPDADAFGSVFSFYELCKALKKKCVDIYVNTPYSDFLDNIFDTSIVFTKPQDKSYDLAVQLDVSVLDRLGIFKDIYKSCKKKIKIDHHIEIEKTNTDVVIIDTDMTSTSEIVLEIAQSQNLKISKKMATYIYAGLVGDSGLFQNSNTTSKTFLHAYTLVESGADKNKVLSAFSNIKISELNAEKFILNNFKMNGHLAYVIVSNKDMKKNKFTRDDLEKNKNKLRNIEGVRVSAIFYEMEVEGDFNGSFRSCPEVDLVEPVMKFGGGGHKNASGVTNVSRHTIREIIQCLARL